MLVLTSKNNGSTGSFHKFENYNPYTEVISPQPKNTLHNDVAVHKFLTLVPKRGETLSFMMENRGNTSYIAHKVYLNDNE